MRVLWIAERFPPDRGGVAAAAARETALLAPALERLDVLHLAAGLPAGRVRREEREGARVHRLGRGRDEEESLRLLLEAARLLLEEGGHGLVHGFYAVPAGYVAVLAARARGLPSVVSLRGNDLDRGTFSPSRAPFLHWALARATLVLAVTRELGEQARVLSGRESGLRVVTNGVDAERFAPAAPGAQDSPPPALLAAPRPWLLFAGEARFKKGLPALLDLARDRARRKRGSVVLAGGVRGDERELLARFRSGEPEASARLVELPWERDPAALATTYRAADLLVFPSLWDGMPNALLEGMACARPAVATAAGGLGEAIEHGRTGFLVPLRDLDRFPEAVEAALALGPERLAAVGAAARARVLERHSLAQERRALLDAYRDALGAGP